MKMEQEEDDDDEQTPDFEDLLAAYNLSDTTAVSSTANSAGDGVNVGASCSSGAGSSLVRPPTNAVSSLSILKEMARMEPPITDANISIRTASSEIVVKENGIVDFRKPFAPKPVSGGKPANMQRMILDLAQQDRARKTARKTTSCRSLLSTNGPMGPPSLKARKTVMHLGPRTPAFSGQQGTFGMRPVPPTNVAVQAPKIRIPASGTSSSSSSSSSSKAIDYGLQNGMDSQKNVVDEQLAVDYPMEYSADQLYTCVLPPYVPKAATTDEPSLETMAGGFVQRGYPCLDCSDRFLVEPSLTAHLGRRSVHITLKCDICKQELVFHNRCSLLSHVRTHRERNQPSDLCNIRVRPLEPSELVDKVAAPAAGAASEAASAVINAEDNDLGITSSHKKYQCHECKLHCGSLLSLQEHFGFSRSIAINSFKCARCQTKCPTKCSLSAHKRLHDRQRPFLCPECGVIVADSWDVFQRHLSTVCLHLSRTTGYKCPTTSCDALCSSSSELRDHVVESHGDSLHKCQGCPMAFRSLDTFELHRLEKHTGGGGGGGSGGPDSAVQCRTVSKCPLCDVVFQNTDAFRSHLSTHAAALERDLRFMYRCSVCKLFLEDKSMLSRHLKRNHPSIFKMRCKICRSAFRDLDLLIDHMRRKHPEQTDALKEVEAQSESKTVDDLPEMEVDTSTSSDIIASEMMATLDDGEDAGVYVQTASSTAYKKVECRQCRRSFHSTLGLKMHLLRSHSADDKRAWCAVCSEYLPDPKEMAQHGHTAHLDAGQLVCTLCSNMVFATKFGLAKHLDQHAEAPIYPLDCVYCDQNLDDAKTAANHWKSEHQLFSFTCDQCDAQYLQENSFLRHKRCAHGEGDANKKYYRCSMCEDVDFAKRANLVHHLETKHGIPKTDIDLTQLVSTQCSPAKLPESSIATPTPPPQPTPTPPPSLPTPPPPPPSAPSSSKKKKKRKRKKEGKRDKKRRRSRGSSSKSKKSSSLESKRAHQSSITTVDAKEITPPVAAPAAVVPLEPVKIKVETEIAAVKPDDPKTTNNNEKKRKLEEKEDEDKDKNEKKANDQRLVIHVVKPEDDKGRNEKKEKNRDKKEEKKEKDKDKKEQVQEEPEEKSRTLTPPPPKKLKVDKSLADVEHHVCAKCKYEASKRSDFVEHIRLHKKAGENNYQCLECGICFVVEPSLRKHLTYAHKVKDVDKFMVDKSYPTYVTSLNGAVGGDAALESPEKEKNHRPSSSSSLCSSEPVQLQQRIFQCDVCRNTFETELSLRTHMRTHGMAFLKIKRISNVTVNEITKITISSPQKK